MSRDARPCRSGSRVPEAQGSARTLPTKLPSNRVMTTTSARWTMPPLPGWLDSLEHLAVGPTGVWVMVSGRREGQPAGGAVPAGTLRELWSQTQAIAELLDGWARVPVWPLLCVRGSWPRTLAARRDIRVTASRRLAQVVCSGSPVAPGEVERAAGRLLEVLRPAA
jgi:hypothetical protein